MTPPVEFDYAGKTVSITGYSDKDYIYQIIRSSGTFYELDLLEYIRFALRRKPGLILDIGANIGNHSVFFGLFAAHAVASFEPNPEVSPILERNLTTNNIRHRIYKFGLGSSNGSFAIETPEGMSNNIGAAKLIQQDNGMIAVKRLDDIFNDVQSEFPGEALIAVKADIEGMEPEMLRGATSTLNHYKPDLFLEISDDRAMRDIESILSPLGYNKVVSWASTPVWHFIHTSKYSFITRLKLSFYSKVKRLERKLQQQVARFRSEHKHTPHSM